MKKNINTNLNKVIQVTKDGLEALKKELAELVKSRPALVDRLANARAQGDLKENSDFQNAKDELEFLDGRISELEDVLQNAQVVASTGGKGKVGVGAKVTIKVNGTQHSYHIVGEWEADPKEKKISHTSPLGQALVGKSIGDKVEVEAPAGKVTYEIVSVE